MSPRKNPKRKTRNQRRKLRKKRRRKRKIRRRIKKIKRIKRRRRIAAMKNQMIEENIYFSFVVLYCVSAQVFIISKLLNSEKNIFTIQ